MWSWGARCYGLNGLDDAAVAKAMFARQRADSGSEFLPHVQQRVVAIACVLRSRDQLRLWSLGDLESSESRAAGALLRRHREVLARPGVLERRRL